MLASLTRRWCAGGSLLTALALAGCGGGSDVGGGACNGIVNPTKVITTDSAAISVDVGSTRTIVATLSGFCPNESTTLTWASTAAGIATVVTASAGSATVTAVAAGTTTITGTAYDNITRVTVTVTVRPRIANSIDARPNVDTLFPTGTRALTVTVKDQNNTTIVGAPVVWRSITANLATVSATGTVTAVAVGTAKIVATTPRTSPTDSLSDTTSILIVDPCTLLRPITLGTSYTGTFDNSSCKNFLNFPQLDQFSITSTTQAYYSLTLTPTLIGSLVPQNIGSGFYGLIAPKDSTTVGLAVIRAGTFGFLVANGAISPATYRLTTALNPDPRQNCVPTDVTKGVSFQTAVTPTCQQRDLRLLPTLAPNAAVRVTATAQGFPTAIELRVFGSNTLLASGAAAGNGLPATINYTNNTANFPFVYIRVFGGPVQNDAVAIVIDP